VARPRGTRCRPNPYPATETSEWLVMSGVGVIEQAPAQNSRVDANRSAGVDGECTVDRLLNRSPPRHVVAQCPHVRQRPRARAWRSRPGGFVLSREPRPSTSRRGRSRGCRGFGPAIHVRPAVRLLRAHVGGRAYRQPVAVRCSASETCSARAIRNPQPARVPG
jgi:hypothetical protein